MMGWTEKLLRSLLYTSSHGESVYYKFRICCFHQWPVSFSVCDLLCCLCAGIIFFILGNCLNFISFGYAAQVSILEKSRFWINHLRFIDIIYLLVFGYLDWPIDTCETTDFVLMSFFFLSVFFLQSLLAALGSVQFVSNIAFAYFVLNKTVAVKYVHF